MLFRQFYGFIHTGQHHRATETNLALWADFVQGATANHCIQCPLVDLATINPSTEIKHIFKGATLSSGGNNIFYRAFTQPLNRTQAIEHSTLNIDTEVELTVVDIGRQQVQTHGAAFINKGHHLVGLIHIRGNSRGHKFSGIMGLQPAGLIGDQRIGSGVRFVKTIARKFFHQIKNIRCQLFFKPLINGTFSK